jgi:diadenosine tetraphosphate (Ap4A) HIT family hydrolase
VTGRLVCANITRGFWLPILAKAVTLAIDVDHYNIVQNNGKLSRWYAFNLSNCDSGARAAQVVPHVHFHIIPRPDTLPNIQSKSWTMFGRGRRDDLDDSEAAELAAEIRRQARKEIDIRFKQRSLM